MVSRQRRMEARLGRLEESARHRRTGVEAVPAAGGPPEHRDEPPPPQPEALPGGARARPRPPARDRRFRSQEPRRRFPRRSRQQGLESAFGLTWISRIGALTLVIGVAFFFKYAFENHWITETGRVLLGVACAAALLGTSANGCGGAMQRTYAQALTAAGIAFLYLSFWAGVRALPPVGQTARPALMALTTAGACALACATAAAPSRRSG